jgi:hypothetical protein
MRPAASRPSLYYCILASRSLRALRPAASSAALYVLCVLASRTRPDDARGHFAAPCSYQRLAPPSSLLFSIYGHIRPKSALLYSYYIRTVRSDGGRLLSFEPTSFLPIHHNSITNTSFYQELGLLYCTAYQHPSCYLYQEPGVVSTLLYNTA